MPRCPTAFAFVLLLATGAAADETTPLKLMDVFRLRYADEPQVSPDGQRIVYVRKFCDVMKDRVWSNLWLVTTDGEGHRQLTSGNVRDSSPRWSPDGSRLLYISDGELYCRDLEGGQTIQLTHGGGTPLRPAWSPDGRRIAYAARMSEPSRPFMKLPEPPEGAEWAAAPKVIRKLTYRTDSRGYVGEGHVQLFVVSASGGEPKQLTEGPYDNATSFEGGGLCWSPDGKSLVFAANRHADGELDPLDTDLYELSLDDGRIKPLTDRRGPDHSPVVSPGGKRIAFVGFDDRRQGHQTMHLYVMNRDGSGLRCLSEKLDHSVRAPQWAGDGRSLYFLYDDEGDTVIGHITLDGNRREVARHVGGTTLGRPYESGAFSVADDGTVAFTLTRARMPGEVAVVGPGKTKARRLTGLNDRLRQDRYLSEAKELWFSARDGRKVQGWLLHPPGFDPKKKYPLVLEVHGGPFANYGDRFGMELQLYAAAGYVVLYINPRGSTGYGEEFANLIHHRYPGDDFDDLMAGVDAVLEQGHVDPKRLFITGGSGGGVLTAWAVGKTDRFRAAVSCFPVINWTSFVFTADASPFFTRYWFPGMPWDAPENYFKRSPLSLAGKVKTPTMLITGEEDYRTPISEAEQFYKALKLRKIDAALVRVPGAGHDVSARPSHMMAKVALVLEWFERHP